MRTFILIYFWLGVFNLFVRAVQMAGEYPRVKSYSLGLDVATVLLTMPFVLWAAWLLWAN